MVWRTCINVLRRLQEPPPGHGFDVEWGFLHGYGGPHNPGWRTYSVDEIRAFVFKDFGEDIFYEIRDLAESISSQYSLIRDQALDILELLSQKYGTISLARYTDTIANELKPYTISDYVNGQLKTTPNMTRDSQEIAKGKAAPQHVLYFASLQSLDVNKRRLQTLSGVLRNLINYADMQGPVSKLPTNASRKVFIGHGRSEKWRALKDFIKDCLKLEYDEYDRVSPAGLSTQERLSEMLDECVFAFLVLTSEDLHGDGSLHARENVIHEAGLFQGRLGWRKAIIVLEEGCEEFSNISGLGQIRFTGVISDCFEKVRLVLEREGLI